MKLKLECCWHCEKSMRFPVEIMTDRGLIRVHKRCVNASIKKYKERGERPFILSPA